ncbi:MAG: hypothetical protein WDA22_17320 [Bacteroidota bacterium]
MNTKLDTDTLKWFTILSFAGIIFISLHSLSGIHYHFRTFGNTLILGSLLLFYGIEGSKQFKILYNCLLALWVFIVFHSLTFIVVVTTRDLELFRNVLAIAISLSILSFYLFALFIKHLCNEIGLNDLAIKWRNLSVVIIAVYLLPFAFTFIGGILMFRGIFDGLDYGLVEGIPISKENGQLIIRFLLVILPIYTLREINILKHRIAIAP